MSDNPYTRTVALFDEAGFRRLRSAHVLVVGAGAVGGACIEALARSGIGRLTIIDGDTFEISNLNRQPFSSTANLGSPKASAVAERLADIAPLCSCQAVNTFVTDENAAELLTGTGPDAVIDACDDVTAKIALIRDALRNAIPVWSSMGAARKLDPSALRITDIAATQVCPLARTVRRRLRDIGIARGVRCVWSSEQALPLTAGTLGSFMPVTATAGLLLAADVMRTLTEKA